MWSTSTCFCFSRTRNHAVDVRLVPIQQVPQLFLLRRRGASVWMVLKTENGPLETPVPFQGCIGMFGVDLSVQVGKVALSAESDVNEICHARLRSGRKTPAPAGPFLFSRPPAPDGCLPPHRH